MSSHTWSFSFLRMDTGPWVCELHFCSPPCLACQNMSASSFMSLSCKR